MYSQTSARPSRPAQMCSFTTHLIVCTQHRCLRLCLPDIQYYAAVPRFLWPACFALQRLHPVATKRHLLQPRLLSRLCTNSEPAAAAALDEGVCLSWSAGMALGDATDLALAAACAGSGGAGLLDEVFIPGPEPFLLDFGSAEVCLQACLKADAACLGTATDCGFPAAGPVADLDKAAGTDRLTALLGCLAVPELFPAEELEGLAAWLALLALLLGWPAEPAAALPAVHSLALKPLIAVL